MTRCWRVSAAMAVALACRGDAGTTHPLPLFCDHDVVVTVSTNASPIFNWPLACGMTHLIVSEAEHAPGVQGRVVWAVYTPEDQPLRSPITYGLAPSQATIGRPSLPLDPGKAYDVWVVYLLEGDIGVSDGSATFTWWPPD